MLTKGELLPEYYQVTQPSGTWYGAVDARGAMEFCPATGEVERYNFTQMLFRAVFYGAKMRQLSRDQWLRHYDDFHRKTKQSNNG